MAKPKRILIALKTPQQAVELTDLACRVAAHKASLVLVHVVELPPATPIDTEIPSAEAGGKKALQAAERVAKRCGAKITRLILHARSAGDALIDELKERKIDLAVIGYHHRRSLGEILLGTTAQHIARHAPCHLLMSIPRK